MENSNSYKADRQHTPMAGTMKPLDCSGDLCTGVMTLITALYVPGNGIFGIFQCPNCFSVRRELI